MTELWACIDPRRSNARILVTHGARMPLLKAHLSDPPHHPRALPALLEAVALWEGLPIRAALVVGGPGSCDVDRYHDIARDAERTPLYSLQYVAPAEMQQRGRDPLRGMGRFNDLRQLLLFEVAR